MPEHVDAPVGEIHIAHNYSYADATAREAATGFVSADLGKIAQQQDNDSYWVLVDTAPIWVRISSGHTINAQTGTTYTVPAKDRGKLVTHSNGSATAVTLPVASATGFGADWSYMTVNLGVGAVTITPTTSTINGAATLVLNQNEGAIIISDGTDYKAIRVGVFAGSGANSNITSMTGITGALQAPTQVNDSNGNEVLKFASTASAVNEVTITNKATGTGPTIAATGGDTDVNLNLMSKGAGQVQQNGVEVGYMDIPQDSRSADYTLTLANRGGHIFHPVGDNNPRTFTIPANASVAFRVGTAITFVNKINTLTIAITSDTLTWAEDGTTGSRTLAANGIATALKITSTEWLISGTGLS
jgi:hypothetical protein